MTDKKQIIEKVVKLLALSESTNHTPESESAKNMAAKLMAEYDISIQDAVTKCDFSEQEMVLTRQKMKQYDITLHDSICKFNGTSMYIKRPRITSKGRKGSIIYVGVQKDITLAHYMIDIVKTQRNTAWKRYLSEYKKMYSESPSKSHKTKWMNGFSLGVMGKLQHLTKMKKTKIEEFGLVLIDPFKAASAWFESNNRVKQSASRGLKYNGHGYESGKNTSIHTGIKESNKKTLRIS